MADEPTPPQPHGQGPEPVPVGDTAREIVETLRTLLGALPQVALTPFLAVFLAQGGVLLATGGAMMDMENEVPQVSPLALLAFPVILLAYSVFLVDWHRLVLLGPEAQPVRPRIHLDLRDLRYLWRGILVMILGFLGAIPAALLAPALMGLAGGFVLAGLLAVALALTTMMAVGLVLPATALGRRLGFGESWRATKEVLASLLGLVICVVVPVHIVVSAVAMLYGATMDMHGLVVPLLLISLAMEFFELAVVGTLLSVVYRRRIGVDGGAPEPEA